MDEDIAKQRLRLWLQMLRSVRHVESSLRDKLRTQHDTTLPRFDVLATLDRVPEGMTLSQLSDRLMISNGNVTGIVTRLVDDEMVERLAVAGDRRATQVRLTPAGREAMTRMVADHLGWIDDLFAGLDEADIARGIAMMIDLRRQS